ncbi:hypothetical protein [Thermococcus celericrescens]|uniref:hypothetical protein n=1 Tax=Thermococcus celericrescens TaxID=227598 RepID=UPI001FE04060|nr:hypothetical protein [Thermococcus celericrescens]
MIIEIDNLWKNLFILQCPSSLGGLYEKMGVDNSIDFGFEFGTGMGHKACECCSSHGRIVPNG